MIRTAKVPFLQSKPSRSLFFSTFLVSVTALLISFTDFAKGLDMMPLPLRFLPWLGLILVGYLFSVMFVKKYYVRRYGEWM